MFGWRLDAILYTLSVHLVRWLRLRGSDLPCPSRGFLLLLPLCGLFAAGAAVYALAVEVVDVPFALAAAAGILTVVLLWYGLLIAVRLRMTWGRYDAGSAGRLRGRCYAFECYLGDGWTERAREQAAQKLRDACRWIEAEARRYGVEITLVHEPLDVLQLPDVEEDASDERFDEQEFRSRFFESGKPNLDQRVLRRFGQLDTKANYFLVVHTSRDDEEALAVHATHRLADQVDVETLVCPIRSLPVTYAHEILHVFGAIDLYSAPGFVAAHEQVMQNLWPHHWSHEASAGLHDTAREIFEATFSSDVMGRRHPVELADQRIGPLTAHAVGWPASARERIAWMKRYEACIAATDRRAKEKSSPPASRRVRAPRRRDQRLVGVGVGALRVHVASQ